MLDISKKVEKKQETLTNFFNNCTMSRILDLLIDNPNSPIFTQDFLQFSDVSQRSLYNNLRTLIGMDIVIEIEIGKKKFYKLNTKNPQAKHISKLRDILNIDNDNTKEEEN